MPTKMGKWSGRYENIYAQSTFSEDKALLRFISFFFSQTLVHSENATRR